MPEERYDAIIIGDGQAGGPLSTALAASGRKTAVIERAYAGGTCINYGCTPTKTMIASARVAYLTGRAEDYGVRAERDGVDMVRVRQRKRDIVESFRAGSEQAVREGGVGLITAAARFTGPKTITITHGNEDERVLVGEEIFINTGTSPSPPPLPGLDHVDFLDSTSIMELGEVPEHLLVLGGSYIALEFGQMFRRFGSRVTIVERAKQLVSREDADIAEALTTILRDDGIDVHVGAAARNVDRNGGGVRLVVDTDSGERAFEASHLLVATGRVPNTKDLNLEATGVRCTDRGFVQVTEHLETNVPGIYAMGEVAGTPAFTHMSYDDFRILRTNLLEGGKRTTTDRLVPYTLFTDPQLGRVGLSENEARRREIQVRVATMPMSNVARALEVDEPRGLVKVLVDAESDHILGAAVLGIEGGEVMAMIEIAMMGRLPYTALQQGIFAHPTLAELFNNLFGSLSDEA